MITHYYNRQKGFTGPLCLALGSAGILGLLCDQQVVALSFGITGLLLTFLASCFWHLDTTVADQRLTVAFGPTRLFRTNRDLIGASAVPARSDFLDGWGIHYVPGRPPIWNLSGFDCVEITFANDKKLRVGTNDPTGLAAAINQHAYSAQ